MRCLIGHISVAHIGLNPALIAAMVSMQPPLESTAIVIPVFVCFAVFLMSSIDLLFLHVWNSVAASLFVVFVNEQSVLPALLS